MWGKVTSETRFAISSLPSQAKFVLQSTPPSLGDREQITLDFGCCLRGRFESSSARVRSGEPGSHPSFSAEFTETGEYSQDGFAEQTLALCLGC
jgi:hypothetical protein